jgi:acylphosphatase
LKEVSACRCFVSGKVQGVFYRASTARKAHELGLGGYARNLPDGRVEVHVVGDAGAVESLVEWLWQGSRLSVVEAVDCQPVDQVEEKYRKGQFFTA